MAALCCYNYETSFKFYLPSVKYTWKQRHRDDLICDWGIPVNRLKNLSPRQLKSLLRNLKKGKKNQTPYRTLLSQYRREARVVRIYK